MSTDPDILGQRLADALTARANRLTISPAPPPTGPSPTGATPAAGGGSSFALKVVLAAGITGALAAAGWGFLDRLDDESVVEQNVTEAIEIITWLDVGISEDQIDEVGRWLEDHDEVVAVTYVDLDASYEELVTYYEDEPEVTALIERDQLPTSFRIELARDSPDVRSLAAELEAFPQVDSVDFDARFVERCSNHLARLFDELC